MDVFGCFIIPAYTLLFTHDTHWFTTNFSVIGAFRDRRNAFLVWGVLIGCYLLCLLMPVILTLSKRLGAVSCLLVGFFLLLTAVVLPYVPDLLPKISDLHIICAFTASALLVLSLFFIIWSKIRREGCRYLECMKWLGITIALSGVLFSMVGIVSSALEIWFVLSVTLLTRRLWRMNRGLY